MLDGDGLIGHAEIQVGDSVIMCFDRKNDWPETPAFLRLYVKNAEEVIGRGRKAGATIITEATRLFFGDKVGRMLDLWGNIWWVRERVEEVDWHELSRVP